VLVRYKNGLLDKEKATDACVGLAMRDPGALTNVLLRKAYPVIKRTSYRLTVAYERVVRAYLRRRIAAKVQRLLGDFSSRALTFSQAKDALREVLLKIAKIEYE
jgi:hypothetical protein